MARYPSRLKPREHLEHFVVRAEEMNRLRVMQGKGLSSEWSGHQGRDTEFPLFQSAASTLRWFADKTVMCTRKTLSGKNRTQFSGQSFETLDALI